MNSRGLSRKVSRRREAFPCVIRSVIVLSSDDTLRLADLPLVPLVFVLMSLLCIILFAKRDKVLSRSWLGFGAVVTVLLAIIASFGLLFLIGVPFTSLTPLLPFILFGVGLDVSVDRACSSVFI